VKPITLKLVPKDLVATSTRVQVLLVTVTAEVSRVKLPFNVAAPPPVTLLLAASVTTNFKPPLLPRTSVPPLLTVVLPL